MVGAPAAARWRAARRVLHDPWSWATIALAAVLVSPMVFVLIAASGDSEGLWGHLFETVLGRYVSNTLILMAGVGTVSLLIGVTTAWVVFRYDFAGRRVLEWMLLLPAAVPAYIVAYAYTDFLEFAGPVQGALRDLFGWQSQRDYWFPEVRSLGGAILIMGTALYPYVYIMTRTAFRLTPDSLFDIARLHRRNRFFSVSLPLARPAMVAGVALVLMETVSDFGTVEYFALETLSLGIFNVWIGMNSLPAAAQISTVAVLFVISLLLMETYARSRRRYADDGRRTAGAAPRRVTGGRAAACVCICLMPVTLGFLVPSAVLAGFVVRGYSVSAYAEVAAVALNSVFLSLTVAVLVMIAAILMVTAVAFSGSRLLRAVTALSATGYAFPGTILAVGVVAFSGAVDNALEAAVDALGIVSFDAYLTGSLGLVLIACMVRYHAVGFGAMTAGINRLPPNMISASRVLGRGRSASLASVVLPLTRSSIVAGGLLVFVDVMKELPMVLLLRPFNYETLATYVYQFARDERLEEAALPALIIVMAGLGPVVVMNMALRRFGGERLRAAAEPA